ncbi:MULTISPECIES: hypothetical protein [unclassified Helicobacter]|uniref:hypothetical protein n=1 Tax=unclassified Helicobacter TaxID=2593540 RepID=UPI000CF16ABE|nr:MULTISPECIES: hypothetical protein [unclassified Helicobacter]
MQIQNQNHSLSNILSKRYQENIFQTKNASELQELESQSNYIKLSNQNAQDYLDLSQDYKKIKQIRPYIKDALKDVPSFLALADKLKREALINQQEEVAMDFLAKKSPKLDFDSFEATRKQQGINPKMQQTIQSLMQKLQMITYLNHTMV